MYPMRLERAKSATSDDGVYGECYDGSYVALIALKPVLELYCKTGYPDYKEKYLQYVQKRDTEHHGWICIHFLFRI